MSICFSEVTLSDSSGLSIRLLIDGSPDEDELRRSDYLRDATNDFVTPINVSVQHYCYLTQSNEEDADSDHLSLISAYDELAELCNTLQPIHGVGAFTDRDDVEHLGYFAFQTDMFSDE